jgi:hypothetical protein
MQIELIGFNLNFKKRQKAFLHVEYASQNTPAIIKCKQEVLMNQ